ncbi:hypothetical protein LTR37_004834 [Vermiconidia calcicola]|uniref:Uncharacterized protein n=1 Tax=Vermiconidia calcicola TaxID=1690605 RepID=A0ACC3NL24_9PEZI|nr:hypothetical protein LTR37_004834 [Vermiconidia calcicola]
MFAARANQENAIYEQQTAAAAKPLNQGVKGLAPKTPGNKAPKTPFKVSRNDENATFGVGKTGGKGKQDGLFEEGKGGRLDKAAFVTPAGPRTRAPLGNKTANAKATAFQTPAPPSAKHTSPRMRRAKIKIHEAEATTAEDEEEEPEIEYMPPREVPLPDHPDDWPHDRTYPQFEGNNLTRGWWSEFAEQKDDDEEEQFSDFEEKLRRIEELNEKKKKQQAAQQANKATTVQKGPMQKTTRDPLTTKPPQTLKARSAASALSSSTKPTPPAKFAAPTTAVKSRLPSVLQFKKPAIATGNTRHTVAKVASNSTLGYSKGRAVSASKRQPLSGMFEKEAAVPEEKATSNNAASLDELFGLQDVNVVDEGADDGLRGSMGEQLDEIDEEDGGAAVFQLDAIEL